MENIAKKILKKFEKKYNIRSSEYSYAKIRISLRYLRKIANITNTVDGYIIAKFKDGSALEIGLPNNYQYIKIWG